MTHHHLPIDSTKILCSHCDGVTSNFQYERDCTAKSSNVNDAGNVYHSGGEAKSRLSKTPLCNSNLTQPVPVFDLPNIETFSHGQLNSFRNTDMLPFGDIFNDGAMMQSDVKRDDNDFSSRPWNHGIATDGLKPSSQNLLGAIAIFESWFLNAEVSNQTYDNDYMAQHFEKSMTTTPLQPEDTTENEDDDSDAAIGTALKNGKFKCNLTQCAHKTFNRPAELRRHHSTIHAAQKPEFWCTVAFCPRSVAGGGEAFRRKYRLQDHMRKMHNGGASNARNSGT